MSAVSVAVLAGVVVCGPISPPFLAGVVTAVVDGLVDYWGSFETSNTTLVAVGTIYCCGVACTESCRWSNIFNRMNLVSGIAVVDVAGEAGNGATVVLPCIVTACTERIV